MKKNNYTYENKMSYKFYNYTLVLYMLLLSGNPFFNQNIDLFGSFTLIFFIPIFLRNPKIYFNKTFLLSLLFFVGFEVFHSIIFSLDYSKTIIKIALLYIYGYSIIIYIGKSYINIYVKSMTIIALVSFIFYAINFIHTIIHPLYNLADNLFPLKGDYQNYKTPTLLIYTFDPNYIMGQTQFPRNAGIFWEAGAFGSFLVIAYFLYLLEIKPGSIRGLFDRTSKILILAIITTFSTTCFVALFFVLILFSFKMKGFYKVFVSIFFILLGYYLFINLQFLKPKIEQQFTEAYISANRFGALLLDLKDIKERPLTGWSRRTEVLFGNDLISSHRPNGITNLLRSYGFIYTFLYWFLIYKSFEKITTKYNLSRIYAIAGLTTILILAFSQLLFEKVFFRSIIYLGLNYTSYYMNRK
ncbi:hypothetical protein [Rosettibacter firmus]|uniref:hypothetical protein n=1 Tax=Rosettibacter firmus TaxID=3111522 RepID=UPI00336BCD4D